MAEKPSEITIKERDSNCPFETNTTTCKKCGGIVNVYAAGPGLTEVHCDDCGAHYNKCSGFFKKH